MADAGEMFRAILAGPESIPQADCAEDVVVIQILRKAFAETRKVAEAERTGERIDGDTMGFVIRGET